MSQSSAQRSYWVDAAKGVAIILVVIGHGVRGLMGSDIGSDEIWAAIGGRVYAFHMPVFFALSGLFFLRSIEKSPPTKFLKSRVMRLLYPMVLWTYLFLLAKVLAGPFTNAPVSLSDMLISPFPGRLHLWFLWTLFLLSILCFALRPFIKDGRLAMGAIAAALVVSALLYQIPLSLDVAHWVGSTIQNLPFFLVGILLGQPGWLKLPERRTMVILAVMFVALVAVWHLVAGTQIAVFGTLFLTVSFLIIARGLGQHTNGPLGRVLITLGQASMAIYLLHTFFSAGIREALLIVGIENGTVHFALGTLLGVVGPLIVLAVAQRMGLDRVLGIQADGKAVTPRPAQAV